MLLSSGAPPHALYLTRAKQVSGEILYVDGGAHAGR
jgi:enoyl-[acyl-carrier-protein] reductase (NADH)